MFEGPAQKVLSSKALRFVGLWCLFWITVFGIHDGILKPNGINYVDNPFAASGYFLFWSVVACFLFKAEHVIPRYYRNPRFFSVLVGVYVFFLLLTSLLASVHPITEIRAEYFREMKVLFPFFESSSWAGKSSGIFFQQTMVLLLVFNLSPKMTNLKRMPLLCGLAFFVVHLPSYFLMGSMALLFIIPASIAGMVFSWIILNVRYGLLLSTVIHLMFYFKLGIFFRYILSVPTNT